MATGLYGKKLAGLQYSITECHQVSEEAQLTHPSLFNCVSIAVSLQISITLQQIKGFLKVIYITCARFIFD